MVNAPAKWSSKSALVDCSGLDIDIWEHALVLEALDLAIDDAVAQTEAYDGDDDRKLAELRWRLADLLTLHAKVKRLRKQAK